LQVLGALILAAAAAAAIQLETNAQGQHYFRVVGGATGTVTVFAAGGELPMLGEQSRSGSDLVFAPRFALQPGIPYRVEFRGREASSALFRIKPALTRASGVEHIYPSAAELPENQLRLYLHFVTPMARGDIYAHVHLLDAQGREIQAPFLELGEELWDPKLQRFTLLFDPGRVKRDLVPNREVGAPLVAGGSYTLLIDAQLRDAAGSALQAEYRKHFTVRGADRISPDPKQWHVVAPTHGSRAALTVSFPESLDHALLQRCLSVRDPKGATVAGAVGIDHDEQRWQFQPRDVWRSGEYQLEIDTTLEDLGGNRIGRLFDEDTLGAQPKTVPARASLRFTVKD
jgi:hypothetical protein